MEQGRSESGPAAKGSAVSGSGAAAVFKGQSPLASRGPVTPQQRIVLLDIWERSGAFPARECRYEPCLRHHSLSVTFGEPIARSPPPSESSYRSGCPFCHAAPDISGRESRAPMLLRHEQ